MTFLEAVHSALTEALRDASVLLCGQLVKYGLGGMTTGLAERYPQQVITYPVCENLMHASAMGLALAGFRPVVVNERMDFLALALDPLLNHIPVWPRRMPLVLPITVIAVVGKGKGQGPQHSKNLAAWFRAMDGWTVKEPASPEEASYELAASVFGNRPTLYVLHREFFNVSTRVSLPQPARVGLCGASERHEREFYIKEHTS